MADEKKEQKSLTNMAEGFFIRTKYLWLGLICAVCVALIVVLVCTKVTSVRNLKCADELDQIVYSYENDSQFSDEAGLKAAREVFCSKLDEYTAKYGKNKNTIRAYMMLAKIYQEDADYAKSAEYWNLASSCDKKSYLAGISDFNAAVCYEQLDNLDEAENYYVSASQNKNFLTKPHAIFNAARVLELKGDKAEALNMYGKIIDGYAEDDWAKLAKSRIIYLSRNE